MEHLVRKISWSISLLFTVVSTELCSPRIKGQIPLCMYSLVRAGVCAPQVSPRLS